MFSHHPDDKYFERAHIAIIVGFSAMIFIMFCGCGGC